jgi:CubicO group peptidase (beta-lactamase class C family)
MIAEAATGETVANLTDQRFFFPLNMKRTALTRLGMKTEPYAHDYFWAENELLDTSGWNLSWDWTAGSAVTFISDMLCRTQALLGGEVVSTTTLKQMTTPVPPAVEYGF